MGERRLIDYTNPIPWDEAEKILLKLEAFPMAKPLVMLFKRASNPKTYRTPNFEYPIIYAGPRNREIEASIALGKKYEHVTLDLLPVSIEHLPHPSDILGNELIPIHISAGLKQTGIWAYGQGNVTTHAIRVYVGKELDLPSPRTRLFFDLLSWFALITEEHCLDISEQPRFWTGDKERPPSR